MSGVVTAPAELATLALQEAAMRAVCTVVGRDKPGIIAAVSSAFAERSVNILDISQTIMQGFFTMITLVDLAGMSISLEQLRSDLDELGRSIEVEISLQHEDVYTAMHRV
ncbi:MAG: ACT domain-containing protein [Alkalispirochaeta sp.]